QLQLAVAGPQVLLERREVGLVVRVVERLAAQPGQAGAHPGRRQVLDDAVVAVQPDVLPGLRDHHVGGGGQARRLGQIVHGPPRYGTATARASRCPNGPSTARSAAAAASAAAWSPRSTRSASRSKRSACSAARRQAYPAAVSLVTMNAQSLLVTSRASRASWSSAGLR